MFRFKCGSCDEWHESEPSVACQVPDAMLAVPPAERRERTKLSGDLAVLDDEHFYIRACMHIPIHDATGPFVWGVWVEVSLRDFREYMDVFDDGRQVGPYAATLANSLFPYEDSLGHEVTVHPQVGDDRPLVEPSSTGSLLDKEFREGMPNARATAIFQKILHRTTTH